MDYTEINSKTVDRWVDEGWVWGIPITHETYVNARNGVWDVFLTPTKPVPHEWFGDLRGKAVLGLASGGGQQMPVFSALGAVCTVLDYSDRQLDSERLVAQREGYKINIVKADMITYVYRLISCAPEQFDSLEAELRANLINGGLNEIIEARDVYYTSVFGE